MAEGRESARRTSGKKGFSGTGAPNTFGLNHSATRAMQAVNDILTKRFGKGGPVLERAVTWEDLTAAGLANVFLANGQSVGGSGDGDFKATPIPVPSTPVYATPDAPTGLVGTGAQTVNILQWNPALYAGHAHTEVYKNGVNNLATAVLAGRTQSRVYADRIGSGGVTAYYWIRHVNELGVNGPYNASAGVAVTTGSATTGEASTAYDLLVIDKGVIVEALIGDAEITGAKIKNATIDSAKIITLNAAQIAASEMAVGQYIRSVGYAVDTNGWSIQADGYAEFQNIKARGDIQASSVAASVSITSPVITGGVISGTSITGGTVTGTTVNGGTFVGNLIRSTDTTKYIDLNGTSGFLLNTPGAKIRADGSTIFLNQIATGTDTTTRTFDRDTEGTIGDPIAGKWTSIWKEWLIDTGVDTAPLFFDEEAFVARIWVATSGGTGGTAGNYKTDIQYEASVVLGAAYYYPGAAEIIAQDPLLRGTQERIYVRLRARVYYAPAANASVTITDTRYSVQRVT